ncbi:MAG: carbohydrate-binding domain-containing protein [Bacilli bacterium]|nr:carbohydrate-binding domain-containing protein [Bacilli bacterium]
MKNKKLFLLPCTLFLALSISACGNIVTPSNSHNPSHSYSETEVSGVSLNYDTLSMQVGKTVVLTATVTPDTALNKEVSWTSSNSSVATVSNGAITAIKEGTTVITVTTKDGGFTATCVLTVVAKDEDEEPYKPDETDTSIYFITSKTLNNGTYDSSEDEYTFSVNQNYKQIYVNAPDKSIVIELNGVTIENGTDAPIYVEDCEGIDISAKKNTVNYVKDKRTSLAGESYKGAIYVANGDLKLKGTGTLNIESTYYNGIHCKDDVKVQKQTLNITAPGHGIKGNDSVTITSGTIDISCGGDGLHTDNSDISNKGNQKGDVTINGGTLTINSWSDAIQAAYNAVVDQADDTVPTVVVAKTNKYSSYTGDTVSTSTTNFYLRMNSTTYSNGNYNYAAYIDGNWYPATYKGTQSEGGQQPGGGFPGGGGGGSRSYYIYQLDKPAGATSFTLYRFNKGAEYSQENYVAKSDAKAFNSAYDMVTISVNNKTISFSSWSNYSSGNSNGADVSAKGIKAENEIYIKKGTIDIKAYDDAVHANNDGVIENGNSPLGNVNVSGGSLTLEASDDGMHADGIMNISGGEINVKTAYEGLEANVFNVSGGSSYVYATDDGMNATKGKSSPAINVSGGLLDVEVPTSGDTDGIDSNGTYTQTGGVVIVKGPGNAGGNNFGAAALDTDGNVSISDGTLIIFGGMEKTPTTNSSITKTLVTSNTVSTGSHSVAFPNSISYSTTLKTSSRGLLVYSALGTATLK